MCVNDLLTSVPTLNEDLDVTLCWERQLELGGFNLTKFVFNRGAILDQFVDNYTASKVGEITTNPQSRDKKWDVENDVFHYMYTKSYETNADSLVTKRAMLSQVFSLYDPFLISPIKQRGKLLFQEVLWERMIKTIHKQVSWPVNVRPITKLVLLEGLSKANIVNIVIMA